MKTAASTGFWGCAALVLTIGAGPASAQGLDALVKAKALYAEASYDDALRVLGTHDAAEAHQYRALCFLALGNVQEAERSLEALIKAAPEFAVSEADSPPRLVTMFSQTKRRVLPGVVRSLFTEARDDYQAKDLDRARRKFEKVMTLAAAPELADAPDVKDLQLLSSGYLDIVKNAPAPVPAKPAVRPPATAPPTVSAGVFPSPAPAAPKPRTATVVPAQTIRQTVPPYTPPRGGAASATSGTVRVLIGANGKVTSATMETSIDPAYDIRLLAAASSWTYKPATVDGKPVESEKLITVTVGDN